MRRPATVAARLRALVRSTELVLAQAGRLSEDYDTVHLTSALGRLSQAREELRAAGELEAGSRLVRRPAGTYCSRCGATLHLGIHGTWVDRQRGGYCSGDGPRHTTEPYGGEGRR